MYPGHTRSTSGEQRQHFRLSGTAVSKISDCRPWGLFERRSITRRALLTVSRVSQEENRSWPPPSPSTSPYFALEILKIIDYVCSYIVLEIMQFIDSPSTSSYFALEMIEIIDHIFLFCFGNNTNHRQCNPILLWKWCRSSTTCPYFGLEIVQIVDRMPLFCYGDDTDHW